MDLKLFCGALAKEAGDPQFSNLVSATHLAIILLFITTVEYHGRTSGEETSYYSSDLGMWPFTRG